MKRKEMVKLLIDEDFKTFRALSMDSEKAFENILKVGFAGYDNFTDEQLLEAYKDKEFILSNIQETVEVIDYIKPLYNFKASE